MDRNLPDWLMLIEHWVNRGGIGYTLPFLVGARSLKDNIASPTPNDASNLLKEIFVNPFEYPLQIIFCGDLQSLVFGLYRRRGVFSRDEQPSTQGKMFNSPETNTPSVFVRQDMLDKYGDTSEQLINSIVEDFKDPIIKGIFSRSWDRKWSPLTKDETIRIKNILGLN